MAENRETRNRLLFNFAVSYGGGGYKRLYEYAKWFDTIGGAWFIIHPRCKGLIEEFKNDRFVLATQPTYTRILNDCEYLDGIKEQIGEPDIYYSYGVPIYYRFGKVNWFHLSNVLPLHSDGIPLSLILRLKMGYLGHKIKTNYNNVDVISAESVTSLGLIDASQKQKLFLSVNGSDDELEYLRDHAAETKDDTATVVGTYSYKALTDSYRIFQMLRKKDRALKLMILGDDASIPNTVRRGKNVVIRGLLERSDVIDCLRKTRYYISTTLIENSYNAAAEGIFFADESYISDIGPHRELLQRMPFDHVSIPGVTRRFLHVEKKNLTGVSLKSWREVITEMTDHFRLKLEEHNVNAD